MKPPVRWTFSQPFLGSDPQAWEMEYRTCVQVECSEELRDLASAGLVAADFGQRRWQASDFEDLDPAPTRGFDEW